MATRVLPQPMNDDVGTESLAALKAAIAKADGEEAAAVATHAAAVKLQQVVQQKRPITTHASGAARTTCKERGAAAASVPRTLSATARAFTMPSAPEGRGDGQAETAARQRTTTAWQQSATAHAFALEDEGSLARAEHDAAWLHAQLERATSDVTMLWAQLKRSQEDVAMMRTQLACAHALSAKEGDRDVLRRMQLARASETLHLTKAQLDQTSANEKLAKAELAQARWAEQRARKLCAQMSINAMFAKKRADELLSCELCMERFEQPPHARLPKALLCQHSFCVPCLRQWCAPGGIECPTCREITLLSANEGIAGLKNNYTLLRVLDEFPAD